MKRNTHVCPLKSYRFFFLFLFFLIIYALFTFTSASDFYIKTVKIDTGVIKILSSHDYYSTICYSFTATFHIPGLIPEHTSIHPLDG